MNSNKTYSRHIFIFPFQWDYNGAKKRKKEYIPFEKRTDIKVFDSIFSKKSPLKRRYFTIGQSAKYYNEYTYFYPFARKALYGTQGNESIYYYELDAEDGRYCIDIKTGEISKEYQLMLEKISVHVFDTGVGLISFSIRNDRYSELEDVMRINDFGRRLYPQYMAETNRLMAKQSFLANSITVEIGGYYAYDDFSRFEGDVDIDNTFIPPAHIQLVFGVNAALRSGSFVFNEDDAQRQGTIMIAPLMDDRMYFMSYYYAPDWVVQLNSRQAESYAYESGRDGDAWYRYLFGDGTDKGIANDAMQQLHIKESTYSRWVDQGTLIGITRDSSVYLTNWDLIETHFTSMYYQMAILCLVQRACVLRFSREIADLTEEILGKNRRTGGYIKGLYENYIRFLNQIYFREVTAQIQGIEMYELFQQNMNIERDVKALDGEMTELFNYLEMQEQYKLTKTANLYLPLTLVSGVLGINTLAEKGWFNSVLNISLADAGHAVDETSDFVWHFSDTVTLIVAALCLLFPISHYFKNRK